MVHIAFRNSFYNPGESPDSPSRAKASGVRTIAFARLCWQPFRRCPSSIADEIRV